VPCQLDEQGNPAGTYYAVLSSKEDAQTAKEVNRDWQPRLALQDIQAQQDLAVKINFGGLEGPAKLDPGLYVNVNWDDDDQDGWTNDEKPPDAQYTGDKDDPEIRNDAKGVTGDDDFRAFSISVDPPDMPGKVKLTWSPSGEAARIGVWSTRSKKKADGTSSEVSNGTEFNVADLPNTHLFLEGTKGSDAFRDVVLEAHYVIGGEQPPSDTVKVTLFEVVGTGEGAQRGGKGFYSGDQQEDNDKKHSSFKGSRDKNGRISWDDANGDGVKGDNEPLCEYFRNCMEYQGTVKPTGVTDQVTFDIKRALWERLWDRMRPGDPWILQIDNTPWQPELPSEGV